MQVKGYALYKGDELLVTRKEEDYMKYKVIVYYDNMEDSVHVFNNKKRRYQRATPPKRC